MNQSSRLLLMIPCRCFYNDRDVISPNMDLILRALAGNENKEDHQLGDTVLM